MVHPAVGRVPCWANWCVRPQGDGEEEEGTTESTGDGGVMMGGRTRRARRGRHYDAKDDVILRLEALQPQEVKVCCL